MRPRNNTNRNRNNRQSNSQDRVVDRIADATQQGNKTVELRSLNCQKSHDAFTDLITTDYSEPTIFFLQEPPSRRGGGNFFRGRISV